MNLAWRATLGQSPRPGSCIARPYSPFPSDLWSFVSVAPTDTKWVSSNVYSASQCAMIPNSKELRASIRHTICRQSVSETKSRKLVGSPFRSESQTLSPCKRLRLLISSLQRPRAILSSPATNTDAAAPVHVPYARPAFPSSNPAPSGWSTALRRTASAS